MSASNSYRFTVPQNEKYINLPLEMKWDFTGREDAIKEYEKTVLEQVIGGPGPFEISRYSHKEYGPNNETALNYEFYFYDSPLPVTASTPIDWVNSYITNSSNPTGFSVSQLYYFEKPFRNSFFKLDFYDTPNSRSQKNYFTIILPTQQGDTEQVLLSALQPPVKVKKPKMKLDFVGDKEGFFIYWLRIPEFVSLDTFYMSVKFWDARLGTFVRMMNTRQSSLPNAFIFDNDIYFYNKVVLNYDTRKYEFFDNLGVRIGNGTPLKWFEYINP